MLQQIMTPEWHRQAAVLLAWPDDHTDWNESLAAIRSTYREIIGALTQHEQVILLIQDEAKANDIRNWLTEAGVDVTRILFTEASYDDTWLRDSGPINITIDDSPAFVDYRFNGWGNKFDARLDDRICQQLFATQSFQHLKLIHSDLTLEGGSLDTNGKGVLLTTESCLLTTTRNPDMSKADYEQHFKTMLGINKTIWLTHGELAGDDTDGHIDMLARFCNDKTIAYTSCDDPDDQHYAELKRMEQELYDKAAEFNLVALPIPKAIFNESGQRLPASYANFLIINEAVLVPVYNDTNDAIACERLAEIFADRTIVPINALNIIQQGGSLHCLTMQFNGEF